MPGKVKARVLAARNLPVMDRSSDTTDAFAEVRFGSEFYKTDICRKSLNPVWNSDWFRFDVDDRELQDEPLHIRIMDYDTYSANDAIGKVYIDLNPLLLKAEDDRTNHAVLLSGWLPIFDTMHGVRGEVNVQVKVELFSDLNKFRTSSCGVKFYIASSIPEGYRVQFINGFVQRLLTTNDPEYQWIDRIRTPRASNEARQALFMKLSSTVQRKIGLMALELGANAVLGYQQKFDLEGESIVVRGIGTAVTLVKQVESILNNEPTIHKESNEFISSTGGSRHASGEKESEGGYSPKGSGFTHNPVQSTMSTPAVLPSSKFTLKPGMLREGLEVLEYPFLTLHTFPEGFIQRIGGLVSCRSVKLLEGELEDNKTLRESWWEELRKEIRSHARCLGCNLVVGYSEDTAIWEDCIVLSSRGTAAYGNLQFMLDLDTIGTMYGPPFMTTNNNAKIPSKSSTTSGSAGVHENFREVDLTEKSGCSLVHLPATSEIPATYAHRCNICGKNPVPDILFTTIEPLVNQLTIVGRGCVIQAKVLRTKKDMKGESNAKEISDSLPFIEYELHRQLYNKLKVKGMNAIFGLKTSFSMSDRLMVATATGTGVFLAALSPPSPPRLVMTPATAIHHKDDQDYLHRMQKRLEEKISENIIYHGLNDVSKSRNSSASEDNEAGEVDPATSASAMDYDLLMGNKDTCVLEIDDSEDADILDSIMDRFPPSGIQTFSTEELIGIASGHIVRTSQMFTHVWRGRIQPHTKDLTKVCQRSMASVYYKLRRLKPCLIGNVFLKVDIDEENDLQCSISGIAISLAHDGKTRGELAYELTTMDNSEAEDESVKDLNDITSDLIDKKMTSSTKRNVFFVESKEPEGIVLTPQSYIPGAKNEKYLGNLNFFLIRETSSLREAGGLSNFVQSFVCEIHAIVRAHVAALGGNALISYFLSEFVVMHNPHKNQAQCLIHVGGDSVQVTYFPLS